MHGCQRRGRESKESSLLIEIQRQEMEMTAPSASTGIEFGGLRARVQRSLRCGGAS